MSLISTQDVADRLGVTIARVQQLIWEGKLPAQKIGRTYIVEEADLEKVKNRKRGRPPAPEKNEIAKKTGQKGVKKNANGRR
jgi:excisionase family DNA binding protein